MMRKGRRECFWVLGFSVLFCMLCFSTSYALSLSKSLSGTFPLPPGLEDRVKFWKKIFTEYTSRQIVFHDADHLDVIYDVVDFQNLFGGREISATIKNREVKRIKSTYRNLLRLMARKDLNPVSLSKKEYELYLKFQELGRKSLLRAPGNIRTQWGLGDKFLEGLVISGRYMDEMKSILRKHGLPEGLIALPYIESSFDYRAYSKRRAAGVWQFIPSTGRLFLKISRTVDERLDPLMATEAAAKLLKQNYESLGNWPLAITAYNYGRHGMLRAVKRTGSRNLAEIIERYRGRNFKFASKNFYVEFLAALEIVKDYEDYFGEVRLLSPLEYESIKMNRFIRVDTLLRHLKLSREELQDYNPALRLAAIGSWGRIPAGFILKVPKNKGKELSSMVARAALWEDDPPSDGSGYWYKVRRGDTLEGIARRHKTSVKTLKSLNHIRHIHHIRVGQLLKLQDRTIRSIGKIFAPSKVEAAVEESEKPHKVGHLRKQYSEKPKNTPRRFLKRNSKKQLDR